MQFSSLLQSNGVVAGAQVDPDMTPQLGEMREVSQNFSYHAEMTERDLGKTQTAPIALGIPLAARPLTSGVLSATNESITQVGMSVSLQDSWLNDGVVAPHSDNTANVEDDGAFPLGDEAVQLFYMTSDYQPISTIPEASKAEYSVIGHVRVLPTGPATSEDASQIGQRDASRMGQSLALTVNLDIKSDLMPSVAQSSEPEVIGDGDVGFSAEWTDTRLSDGRLMVERAELQSSAERLAEAIIFDKPASKVATVSQVSLLNQTSELVDASSSSILTGHYKNAISAEVPPDITVAEAESAPKQPKAAQSQDQTSVSVQDLGISQYTKSNIVKNPDMLIEVKPIVNSVEKHDKTVTELPASSTSPQPTMSSASNQNLVSAKRDFPSLPQESSIADHSVDVVSVDEPVDDSITDTTARSPSVSGAIGSGAARYGSERESSTIQAAVNAKASADGFPKKSFYDGSITNRAEKLDETTVLSSPPVPNTAPTGPSLKSTISKAEFLSVTQRGADTLVVDHGDVKSAAIEKVSKDPPIDMIPQSNSVSSAAERSAALYSGVTENVTRQAIPDGGSRLQDTEITSLYGSADSLSAPLGQVSQIDLLPQTSRVELPAHLAAQIADAARQLPDGPIEISLSPEELGKVKLTFQVSENGAMNVVVAAERAETLELMRRNVDSLLAEFSDLGYEGSSFQFQQDDQNASGDQSDQSGAGRSNGTLGSADNVQSSTLDTDLLSPVRLHLDGTAGMDLKL